MSQYGFTISIRKINPCSYDPGDSLSRQIKEALARGEDPSFVGDARLPLHRLRGLYADHVRRETEKAMLARQQCIKAAS